jgi:class 3 adenylate cyclase
MNQAEDPRIKTDWAASEITANEITSIDEFRRKRDTAVLTIMFTDIKGYTHLTETKGDSYAQSLRQEHDAILTSTIQEGGAGLVVKYIGDAVMAIFSEPTTAVERALLIQERIEALNAANPDREEIQVRIGLHLGQVAVEDRLSTDVFGRHVNRASRIEGLADGGQIYMSYPVFDSAKGWLAGRAELEWRNHGRYALKGIPEPAEIYEVAHRDSGVISPPRGAKKKTAFPPLAAALLLVVLGVALTIGVIAAVRSVNRPTVAFAGEVPDQLVLNHNEILELAPSEGGETIVSLTPIPPGTHVLYFDAGPVVRYYGDIEVTRGENVLSPQYDYYELPSVEFSQELDGEQLVTQEYSEKIDYFIYVDGERLNQDLVVDVELTSRALDADAATVDHTIRWDVTLNGEQIGGGEMGETLDLSEGETIWPDPEAFWEDDFHFYWYRPYFSGDTVRFEVGTYFIEYR